MNKNELINSVAAATGSSKSDAGNIVEAFVNTITEALRNGDDVRLTGFGAFSVAHRTARTGRNPQTGAPIFIPASNHPKFKAGKNLKEAVN